MHIAVSEAGLVGKAIVKDLAVDADIRVTAVDIEPRTLAPLNGMESIEMVQADLSKPKNIAECCTRADLVINAVPGFMGFEALSQIISDGVDVVDVSFF